MTTIKICGITNLPDALLSAELGADELGFNFYDKSPRFIVPAAASLIVSELPENVSSVGVFVNESIDMILHIATQVGLAAIQLHGDEDPDFVHKLRKGSGLKVIKAIRVAPDFQSEDAAKYEADAILLDGYSSRERGGTGDPFDWNIAIKVKQLIPRLYLAGGLSPDNVGEAIMQVDPFAVDVCSRIESTPGTKDGAKLASFINAVKKTV